VLASSQPEQLLVLAKGIELSWETTKALLILQAGRDGLSRERLNQCFASFSRLQSKTALAALANSTGFGNEPTRRRRPPS